MDIRTIFFMMCLFKGQGKAGTFTGAKFNLGKYY